MSAPRRIPVRLHNPSPPPARRRARAGSTATAPRKRNASTPGKRATAYQNVSRRAATLDGKPRATAPAKRATSYQTPSREHATPNRTSNPKRTTMAKKKKGSGKKSGKRKAARSAKQRAATARMLAANKRARSSGKKSGHGGGKKKSGRKGKRSSGRRKGRPSGAHPVPASKRTSDRSARHTKWHRVGGYFRRTNPSLPMWAQIGIGAFIGIGVPAIAKAGARRFAPEYATLIGDGVAAVGAATGLALGHKMPVLGASMFVGSVGSAVAPALTATIERTIAPAGSLQERVASARLAGLRLLEGLGPRQLPPQARARGLQGIRPNLGTVRRPLGALAQLGIH